MTSAQEGKNSKKKGKEKRDFEKISPKKTMKNTVNEKLSGKKRPI